MSELETMIYNATMKAGRELMKEFAEQYLEPLKDYMDGYVCELDYRVSMYALDVSKDVRKGTKQIRKEIKKK